VRRSEQRNFEAVLDLMAGGQIEVAPLITRRFPLGRAVDALLTSGEHSLGVLLEYPAVRAGSVQPAEGGGPSAGAGRAGASKSQHRSPGCGRLRGSCADAGLPQGRRAIAHGGHRGAADHSAVDFNLQIPAHAAMFVVMLALGWACAYWDPLALAPGGRANDGIED